MNNKMKYIQYFEKSNDVNLNEYYPKVAYCNETEKLILKDTNEPLSNVSVLLTNGKLVNKRDIPSDGYSKDEVVGFAIQGYDHDILVHPDDPVNCYFCGANQTVPDYEVKYTGLSSAYGDLNGKENTDILCNNWSWNTDWACNVAKNTIWKDGRTGYLPAFGELNLIETNVDDLNQVRLSCGCTEFLKQNYWSSTVAQRDENNYFSWVWISDLHGYNNAGRVQGYYSCIPIAKLNE